ncbi:multidomain presynaptic cytomatrix related protein [Aspergillus ruber CBS 135680]|uniref:Autophagy-related protein 29 n=1 Tax=Aspergillus ruber (strain CBS 135680) TaxID=1388766 RepID=A0A017SGP3_ASPRC|nr:uncharacterized protein EURHEDRAFT_411254 [Aspergillus ruber CBS 135680]EYE96102.1 hypothetical protein EURHEDRAFT_411254 [Aspergillus ruber CBS 135680]
MALPAEPGNSKFTVFLRLPFPRGDFVDPPPVEWDAAKDQALWDVLSRLSKGDDTDWKTLANNFGVTLQFLLQQAAWLYDRQLTQFRAQMRKVGTVQSASPSPMLGSTSGSFALGGQAKGAQGSRPAPSRLTTQQKDAQPQRIVPRRTSSNATVNQIRQRDQSRNVTPTAEMKDPKPEGFGRRPSANIREQPPPAAARRSPTLEEEGLSTSSSESESDEEELDNRRNPRFKRFGKLSMHRPGLRDDEEDDDDDSPAFLPYSRDVEHRPWERSGQDLNATLRLNTESPDVHRRRSTEHPQTPRNPMTTESSMSSASSGVPVSHPSGGNSRHASQVASPRRGELASPRRPREASDGTPSMGSSFSDIDDSYVTESVLAEAQLSNIQGGMASRMSTIGQAFRSRYL